MRPHLVDASLFATVDPLALRGSHCRACGTIAYPATVACPRDGGEDVEDVALPTDGTLWTWTVQTFEPRPPYRAPADTFEPFVVGYVDLGIIRVQTRIDAAPEALTIGMPLQVTTVEIATEDGELRLAPAFGPRP